MGSVNCAIFKCDPTWVDKKLCTSANVGKKREKISRYSFKEPRMQKFDSFKKWIPRVKNVLRLMRLLRLRNQTSNSRATQGKRVAKILRIQPQKYPKAHFVGGETKLAVYQLTTLVLKKPYTIRIHHRRSAE